MIEAAYIGLHAGESLFGRPLSGRTLYNINLSVYLMFQDAKEKGVVAMNLLDKVPMPKKDTEEKEALSAARCSELISSLDPTDRMQSAVLLCAALGLRRTEVVGLSWGDVNFEASAINVHASADDHGGLKEPKTEAGHQLLPMPSQLASTLMCRKEAAVSQMICYATDRMSEVAQTRGGRPEGSAEVEDRFYEPVPGVAVCCDETGVRMPP